MQFPDDVGLLWRLARSIFHLSSHLERDGDKEGQKALIEEGKPPSTPPPHSLIMSQSCQYYSFSSGTYTASYSYD